MGGKVGDLILFVADEAKSRATMCSHGCVVDMGERLGLIDPNEMALCWVMDFPLLEIVERRR